MKSYDLDMTPKATFVLKLFEFSLVIQFNPTLIKI